MRKQRNFMFQQSLDFSLNRNKMMLLQSKIVVGYGCRYSCGRNKRQSKTFRFRSRNKQFLTFHKTGSFDHGFIKLTDFILVFSAFPNFLTKFNCNGSLWITQYNNLCEYTAIVVFASCLNFPNFVLSFPVSPQGCFKLKSSKQFHL